MQTNLLRAAFALGTLTLGVAAHFGAGRTASKQTYKFDGAVDSRQFIEPISVALDSAGNPAVSRSSLVWQQWA